VDVVAVAIVGICMALGAAGMIVAVCGAIYLAIKRQATMVVATMLLVVLLYVFAFWATQAANAIPANREPPRVGSDFGSRSAIHRRAAQASAFAAGFGLAVTTRFAWPVTWRWSEVFGEHRQTSRRTPGLSVS
jgi:hypothetical protein